VQHDERVHRGAYRVRADAEPDEHPGEPLTAMQRSAEHHQQPGGELRGEEHPDVHELVGGRASHTEPDVQRVDRERHEGDDPEDPYKHAPRLQPAPAGVAPALRAEQGADRSG
jgi:hypothetical protein